MYFYKKYPFMHIKQYLFIFIALFFVSCEPKKEDNRVDLTLNEVKKSFAPDKRVALFNIKAIKNKEVYTLNGESNLPEAVLVLKQKLVSQKIDFIDSIQLLPSANLNEKTQAIVTISVANLRSKPKHSAELATQATLGTPLKVLKKEGDWYFIQTPDKYLSWVDAGAIELMDSSRAAKWKTANKVIYKKTYGHSFASIEKTEIVSDLVAGNVLEYLSVSDNFYKVKYPDGREAYVPSNEVETYDSWLDNLDPTAADLVATSKAFMGVPYLWGGTSTKGMDCSGFTKTVYFLNGMVIPRDASQQIHTGEAIDSVQNFDTLKKGDLLFFGTKATDSTAEKVVHVGMWIGNNEFIHASNMVRVSSMDKNASNFDAWNLNRYLKSKRILNIQDQALIKLAKTAVFKD